MAAIMLDLLSPNRIYRDYHGGTIRDRQTERSGTDRVSNDDIGLARGDPSADTKWLISQRREPTQGFYSLSAAWRSLLVAPTSSQHFISEIKAVEYLGSGVSTVSGSLLGRSARYVGAQLAELLLFGRDQA